MPGRVRTGRSLRPAPGRGKPHRRAERLDSRLLLRPADGDWVVRSRVADVLARQPERGASPGVGTGIHARSLTRAGANYGERSARRSSGSSRRQRFPEERSISADFGFVRRGPGDAPIAARPEFRATPYLNGGLARTELQPVPERLRLVGAVRWGERLRAKASTRRGQRTSALADDSLPRTTTFLAAVVSPFDWRSRRLLLG
jgi:hypothetical protein